MDLHVHGGGASYASGIAEEALPAAAIIAAAGARRGCPLSSTTSANPPIAEGSTQSWTTDFRRLAALPNTVAKLSGLLTEAAPGNWHINDLRPFVDTVLDAFGPHRLIFGSDWPVSTSKPATPRPSASPAGSRTRSARTRRTPSSAAPPPGSTPCSTRSHFHPRPRTHRRRRQPA
ncbi:amidohydrolase family protein [Kitasatospora aureofaciens]|uniref:amidohydrolase family protein n=1 Tax=Kitasatospora aureofaciens TaxID=1894 RepID=UPI0027E55D20|nr:amidohydrolase family protein [Kitasatospora aureofaciens]